MALSGRAGQCLQMPWRLDGSLQFLSPCFQTCSVCLVCSLHLSITCAPTGIYYYSCKLPSPAWHLGPHICTEKEPGGRLTIVWLSLFAAHSNDFGLCCFCTVISRWQALTATFSPPISGENIGIWLNRLKIQTKALRGPPCPTCHSLGFARFQQALGMR